MPHPLFVRAEWDADAEGWVVTSDDVPGLTTESETIEALVEKLRVMIPELLSANGLPHDDVTFELAARPLQACADATL